MIVKSLVAVGITGLTVKLLQVMPGGRLLLTHDSVTDRVATEVKVAVMVTVPELPWVMLIGPLFDNE